jgi:hypothetical protein
VALVIVVREYGHPRSEGLGLVIYSDGTGIPWPGGTRPLSSSRRATFGGTCRAPANRARSSHAPANRAPWRSDSRKSAPSRRASCSSSIWCYRTRIGKTQRMGTTEPRRKTIRVFNLISIVAYTWAVLKFGAAHFARLSLVGPWHLTVAVSQTRGALLCNVGEGWIEPSSSCVDRNLLWHLEVRDWPMRKLSSDLRLR